MQADRFYALENSEFQLPFNATDPEGYPLTYKSFPDRNISSVSFDKRQNLVTISVKGSGRVSLNVRDYGSLEDNHTIEIVTIPWSSWSSLPCNCENGGRKH